MNPCANCGATPRPSDKFCNTCGTPVVAAAPPQAAPSAYGGGGGWGAAPPPAPRCQMGHEVPPGQNYCPQGHPIALEQVQFAPPAPQYGQPQQSAPYAAAPYAQAGGGAQPQQPPANYAGYGAPPQYPPQPQAYPPPQAAPAYAPPQQQGGYAPPAAQPPAYSPPAAVVEPAKPAPAPVIPTALTGFLVAFDGNPAGDFWPLNGGRYTLGRANSGETVDVSLADATISSRHAVLEVDAMAGTVIVEDTGSTNGTFVNDEHVGFNGRRDLRDGDRLRLGGYTTIVKVIARG